jgi:hypothetical protein
MEDALPAEDRNMLSLDSSNVLFLACIATVASILNGGVAGVATTMLEGGMWSCAEDHYVLVYVSTVRAVRISVTVRTVLSHATTDTRSLLTQKIP